jgi:hypothetical protein
LLRSALRAWHCGLGHWTSTPAGLAWWPAWTTSPYFRRQSRSIGLNGRDEGGEGDDVNSPDKAYRCEDYQINCGLTSNRLWLLFLTAAFLASLGTLLFNGIKFLVDRFSTKAD